MSTRNVVHLEVRAPLMALSPGVTWATTGPIPALKDESPEDEDPSLWHD